MFIVDGFWTVSAPNSFCSTNAEKVTFKIFDPEPGVARDGPTEVHRTPGVVIAIVAVVTIVV